jgi:PilZ domain
MRNLEERRRSPRTVLEKIVTIQLEQDNHAIVLNFSDGGLGFHAFQPVTGIDAIQFSFSLPNHERIQASGELVWRDVTKKTGGLRLSSLPVSTREQIRTWTLQAVGAPSAGLSGPPIHQPRYAVAAEGHSGPGTSPPPLRFTGVSGLMSAPQPELPKSPLVDTLGAQDQSDLLSADLRALVNSRPKFLSGFVSGAIVSALAMMILFSVYGSQISGGLAELKARVAGKPTTGNAQMAANAPVAPAPADSSASAAPSHPSLESHAADTEGTAAPALSSGAALAELHKADNDLSRPSGPAGPPSDASAKIGNRDRAPVTTGDTGEKELAIAQGYLRDRRGSANGAAVAFLWSAVEKGNVAAEVTLAELYARGEGVTRSCDQARVLLHAAASKGSGEADQQLAQIARERCN